MKLDNKQKQEKADITSNKTDPFDKKDNEVQRKQDNGPDKNQKSEKIIKDNDKSEKMNVEANNKATEKASKVDKPEKTNKDGKNEEEKKPAEKKEEKVGKSTAKSPTGTGGKTLPSPDSKNKVSLAVSCTHWHTPGVGTQFGSMSSERQVSRITQRSRWWAAASPGRARTACLSLPERGAHKHAVAFTCCGVASNGVRALFQLWMFN